MPTSARGTISDDAPSLANTNTNMGGDVGIAPYGCHIHNLTAPPSLAGRFFFGKMPTKSIKLYRFFGQFFILYY